MFTHLRKISIGLARANIISNYTSGNINLTRSISSLLYPKSNKSQINNEDLSVRRYNKQGISFESIYNHDSPLLTITTNRQMSYDSSNKVHKKINDLITNSKKRVFLFMKGVPKEPSCRYSGLVIQILDAYGVDYDSFDVLENSDVRQELKSYSDWPTIPQVFVDGSFVGGCDILLQMHQSGELKDLFKSETETK